MVQDSPDWLTLRDLADEGNERALDRLADVTADLSEQRDDALGATGHRRLDNRRITAGASEENMLGQVTAEELIVESIAALVAAGVEIHCNGDVDGRSQGSRSPSRVGIRMSAEVH